MELPVTLIGWLGFASIILLTALTGLIANTAIEYANARVRGMAFEQLRNWARTYVAALEQSPDLNGLASEEKKQRAVIWIVNKAGQLGISISNAEASHLIEEAVYFVKDITLPAIDEALD